MWLHWLVPQPTKLQKGQTLYVTVQKWVWSSSPSILIASFKTPPTPLNTLWPSSICNDLSSCRPVTWSAWDWVQRQPPLWKRCLQGARDKLGPGTTASLELWLIKVIWSCDFRFWAHFIRKSVKHRATQPNRSYAAALGHPNGSRRMVNAQPKKSPALQR